MTQIRIKYTFFLNIGFWSTRETAKSADNVILILYLLNISSDSPLIDTLFFAAPVMDIYVFILLFIFFV